MTLADILPSLFPQGHHMVRHDNGLRGSISVPVARAVGAAECRPERWKCAAAANPSAAIATASASSAKVRRG